MNNLSVVLNLARLIVADCEEELGRGPHADEAFSEVETLEIVKIKAGKIVSILEQQVSEAGSKGR